MSLQRLNLLALLLSLLLLATVMIWPGILAFSHWTFLVMLVVVGIPHGAADHLIRWKNPVVSRQRKIRFFTCYLGLIVLVGLSWLFSPEWAFILFLLISAFHFGQSQLFYLELPSWLRYLVFTAWGVLILAILTLFNLRECLMIFQSLEILQVDAWLTIPFLLSLICGGLLLCTGAFLMNWKRLSGLTILTEIICLLLITWSAIYTNVVFAFTLYFGIWHSLRSLILEYQNIRTVVPDALSFIRNLLPFTLLALLGMTISYFILTRFYPDISPYMVFIVLISCLTLPHLIIMDEVYENAAH